MLKLKKRIIVKMLVATICIFAIFQGNIVVFAEDEGMWDGSNLTKEYAEKTVVEELSAEYDDKSEELVLDWANSTVNSQTAIINDTIMWKIAIEGNYNGERLILDLNRNDYDSKVVYTKFNEEEHCFYGEYQLSEYGINGVYKITGYSLFGFGENSTAQKEAECQWLDVEVSGLKQDSDKPLLDLSSVTMTSESGKSGEVALNETLYVFIPVTDKTSGIDYIWLDFWKYNETTQLWEECGKNMCYANSPKDVDNGYIVRCHFRNYEDEEGKYYIQYIAARDYADNVASCNTIMGYGENKGNIIPGLDMENLRLTVTPAGSHNNSNVCNAVGHSYKEVTVAATTSSNGYTADVCSVCGNINNQDTLYRIDTVILKYEKNAYTGKELKPDVVVKDSTGREISKDCYTVTYSNNKNVGQATVTVTFKNNYAGTVRKTFTIFPKGTSITKAASKKKGFTVRWKKQASQTTGYEIQYSTNSKFKGVKTLKGIKVKTTSKSVTKLKAKKGYYVRIRTYKTVKINGKSVKLYSSWSKVKKVTTKR